MDRATALELLQKIQTRFYENIMTSNIELLRDLDDAELTFFYAFMARSFRDMYRLVRVFSEEVFTLISEVEAQDMGDEKELHELTQSIHNMISPIYYQTTFRCYGEEHLRNIADLVQLQDDPEDHGLLMKLHEVLASFEAEGE